MFGPLDNFTIEQDSVLTVETFLRTTNIHSKRPPKQKIVFFTVTKDTPWTACFLPYDQTTLTTLYAKNNQANREIRGRFYGPFWINVSNWKPKDSDPYFTEKRSIQTTVFNGSKSGYVVFDDPSEYYERIHPRDASKSRVSRWLSDPTLLYVLNDVEVPFKITNDNGMTLNGLIHTFGALVSSTSVEPDYSELYCRAYAIFSTRQDKRIVPMPLETILWFSVVFPRFYFGELRSATPYDSNGPLGKVQRYPKVKLNDVFLKNGTKITVVNFTIKVRTQGTESVFQKYLDKTNELSYVPKKQDQQAIKEDNPRVSDDKRTLELESQITALKTKVKELEDANSGQVYKSQIDALQKRVKEMEPIVREKALLQLELDVMRMEKSDSDRIKEEKDILRSTNEELNAKINDLEAKLSYVEKQKNQLILDYQNAINEVENIKEYNAIEREDFSSKIRSITESHGFTKRQQASAEEALDREIKKNASLTKANEDLDKEISQLKGVVSRQNDVILESRSLATDKDSTIMDLKNQLYSLSDALDKKTADMRVVERRYAALEGEKKVLRFKVDELLVQVNNRGYMLAFTKLSGSPDHSKKYTATKATWKSLASKDITHNYALFKFSDVQLDPEDFYDPTRARFSTRVVYQEIKIENLPVSISDDNGNIKMFDDQNIMRKLLGFVNRTKFDLCLPLWLEDDVMQPSEYVRVFDQRGHITNYPHIIPHGSVYVDVPTFNNLKAVVNYDFRREVEQIPDNASTWMVSNIQKMTIDSIGNIKTVACLMMKLSKYKSDHWLRLDRIILCSYEK